MEPLTNRKAVSVLLFSPTGQPQLERSAGFATLAPADLLPIYFHARFLQRGAFGEGELGQGFVVIAERANFR